MVTTFFPPYHTGGDAVFVKRLSAALAREGHEVDVIHDRDAFDASGSVRPSDSYTPPQGVSVLTLSSPFGRLSPLLTHQTGRTLLKARLREQLERGQYDVIHFHNISLIGLDALTFGKDAVRLLTTHEHWLVCPTSILWRYDREVCTQPTCVSCTLHAGRPPQWWRHGTLLRHRLAHLDRCLAPSQFVVDSHRQRGVDLPFEILPHFIPTAAMRRPDDAPLHPRPYFLYVGRLIKAKGVQTLFEAFQGNDGPDLLIAGDGDYADALRDMARDLPRIVFLGHCRGAKLSVLYRDARATLVPSLCYEVFGMVVLEAFAQGTPVVARKLGALTEIVTESQAGLLFEDTQGLLAAVSRFADDDGFRDRLGEQARRAVAERWSEAQHLDRYFSIIEDARATRAKRPVA